MDIRYCGIELKGNDAILVVLEDNKVIETAQKKITLVDTKDQKSVRLFYSEIIKFFTEYKIDIIGIKERATKGRFSGGSISFKMESLIQNTDFNVSLAHSRTITSKLKNITIDSDDILKYQEGALHVAHYLSQK